MISSFAAKMTKSSVHHSTQANNSKTGGENVVIVRSLRVCQRGFRLAAGSHDALVFIVASLVVVPAPAVWVITHVRSFTAKHFLTIMNATPITSLPFRASPCV